MYCQTCAAEIQTGLNYCNRCGAVVNASLTPRQELLPADIKGPVRTIGTTITLTTLIGFVILFVGIDGLASKPLPHELLGLMGVSGLLLILIIDVLLIRLLSRLIPLPPAAAPTLTAQLQRPAARELPLPQTQTYMPASTDLLPVSSVTDHTTRTFHPVYQEPRVKS